MPKSKSSQEWLNEHFRDTYVKAAKKEGFRSRSAYKLQEIQKKDHLLKSGMTVVDLGAAPGGWSQIVANILKPRGTLIALDILPMKPILNAKIILGDFTETETLNAVLKMLENKPVDVVLSDMAPNLSGIADVDQARSLYLAELAFDFAVKILKQNGDFLVKIFEGTGVQDYRKRLSKLFKQIKVRKPEASRSRSNEIYLLCQGFKPPT